MVLLLINTWVSLYIARRGDLEVFQKSAQIIIVWLIPVAAAIGLWMFHRSQDIPVKSPKSNSSSNNHSMDTSGAGD